MAAIRRAVDGSTDSAARPRLLDAFVEIALAAGHVASAGAAADELATLAGELEAPLLVALAARAEGSVLLAEGEVASGLDELQRALAAWQALEAPYEAARVRMLVAQACRPARRRRHRRHGARCRGAACSGTWAPPRPCVASRPSEIGGRPRQADRRRPDAPRARGPARSSRRGKTNRAIATDLVISEKTVARHVANIFTKLDLTSRSAATAYAYEHDLMAPSA